MRNYLISLVILIVVYFLHVWGMEGAYVRIGWLDILSHGLVCAGIAFWLGEMLHTVTPQVAHKALIIVTLTLTIGILWEGLEVYYNITGHPLWSAEYNFDTIKDLIVDTIAASVVAYFISGKTVSAPIVYE